MKGLKVGILMFLMVVTINAVAADYYTCASGDWSGSIWNTSSNCAGAETTLPALSNGDHIWITRNITVNSIDISSRVVTIHLSADLSISAQLRLNDQSTIIFTGTGRIIPVGNGNSEKIRFGNSFVWSGNEGTIFGPGTMDKNYNGTLPVELIFFKADAISQGIQLAWATASEHNASHFIVERSSDGVDFQEIGRKDAVGQSFIRNDYNLIDTSPLIGRNYYRLREIDLDGAEEIFPMSFVNYNGNKAVQISPNPYKAGSLTFTLNFPTTEVTSVVILDLSGKEVAKYNFGGTAYQAPLANLNTGTYLVKSSNEGKVFFSRLVVE